MATYLLPLRDKAMVTDDFADHKKRGSKAPGVDFAVKIGTPVYATRKGTVKVAINGTGDGGTMVIIAHSKATKSGYKHLSKLGVRKGQKVVAGQLIGWSGNTGASTGPHLHFDITYLGRYVDPLKAIKG
jgi:murein DD-endopeptidase MepM/ murein hydrolase activator NlpD